MQAIVGIPNFLDRLMEENSVKGLQNSNCHWFRNIHAAGD